MPALVAYEHFLAIAARLEWDADAIDLTPDAARWPSLDRALRERAAAFIAAFALAEERVAVDLAPFVDAATSRGLASCFRAQTCDEERHARFFARYLREVLASADWRAWLDPRFAELFEQRLSHAARALATRDMALADAVALYHLLLEGVVFSTGQSSVLAELEGSGELPGLREGMERIVADERWHIGLGVRILREEPNPPVGATATDAAEALGAWGNLLSGEQREAALRLHRRRLAAAGLPV